MVNKVPHVCSKRTEETIYHPKKYIWDVQKNYDILELQDDRR